MCAGVWKSGWPMPRLMMLRALRLERLGAGEDLEGGLGAELVHAVGQGEHLLSS